jgi:hypothetical protein
MQRRILPLATLALAVPAVALAAPPQGARPASEVIRQVEQRPDFGHLRDLEWDNDGYWEVEYVTREGARIKLRLDPLSGEPRQR